MAWWLTTPVAAGLTSLNVGSNRIGDEVEDIIDQLRSGDMIDKSVKQARALAAVKDVLIAEKLHPGDLMKAMAAKKSMNNIANKNKSITRPMPSKYIPNNKIKNDDNCNERKNGFSNLVVTLQGDQLKALMAQSECGTSAARVAGRRTNTMGATERHWAASGRARQSMQD